MAARTFTFLGTGTSVGVPMLGCDCAVCRSTNPRNHRYRCAVLIQTPQGNLLIDTPPELRLQLLRERIGVVHAVLFTHYHADHLFGLDDLRPIPAQARRPRAALLHRRGRGQDPHDVLLRLRPRRRGNGAPATCPSWSSAASPTSRSRVLGERVTPMPLDHAHFDVFGFRIGDVAYCTDVSEIPRASWPRLEGLRVLVLDALRPRPHIAHFGLDQALDVIEQLRPEQAYLTHTSHEMEYEAVNARLPPNVRMAYDGLRFTF